MSARPGSSRDFWDYRDAAWQASLFRILTIAVMATALATGPLALTGVLGGPLMEFLLPIAFASAVVAVLTTSTLARPDRRGRRGPAVRLGEFFLAVILVRIATWLFVTGVPSGEDLSRWLIAPMEFFDGPFVAGVIVVGFAWCTAVLAADDFFELRIQPDEVAARESRQWGDSASQWRVFRPLSRGDVMGRFGARWLGEGMLLVLCAAATRVRIATDERNVLQWTLRDTGLPPFLLAGVVLYFVTGLLLMSHGRLAVLRGRWYNQGVRIASPLQRRWHELTVTALLLLAVLALLLPLGSTVPLADVITWVLALLWRAGLWLLGLLQALAALLLLLLAGDPKEQRVAPSAPAPVPRPVPTQQEALLQLPPWLGGAVVWTVLLFLGIYLLARFLSAGDFNATWPGRLLVRLRLWWRAREPGLARVAGRQVERLRRGLRRRTPPGGPRAPAVPAASTPRERVRAYYLRAIEAARARGVARRPAETPLEYARELESGWPEAGEDVEALTEAFLEARYSRADIGTEQENAAQALWRRVREAFAAAASRGGE